MYTITETDKADLLENAGLLIEAYINLNKALYAQPNFHDIVLRDVMSLLDKTIYEACSINITDIVEEALQLFYRHIVPPRSSGNTFIRKRPTVQYTEKMREKIAYLQQVPQPEQRTPEWYEFRYQHLTASNIWKALSTESNRNQLIFEKCQPLNADKNKYSGVNFDSPMHWGQKYEPVSIQLYEELYQTQVSDFGCIPHKTLGFLAASPDGIVTDEANDRFGRMLEVKNIVNRDITGIPKIEYWVQMQVQLEVCGLNECDFLETRFVEYPDLEAFTLDIMPEVKKGCMMLFMQMGGQPVYEYMPLRLKTDDVFKWQEEMMEKNSGLNWLKNIYWKLDQLSCVLVLRNKVWFANALPNLKEIWQTIQSEKITGYAHRGPKKINNKGIKVKKMGAGMDDGDNMALPSKCFITIET